MTLGDALHAGDDQYCYSTVVALPDDVTAEHAQPKFNECRLGPCRRCVTLTCL